MGWFKIWAPSGALDSRSYGAADCASSIVTPTADVQEFTVPGKNGTVIIPNNRWNNVDRVFSLFISLGDWTAIVGKLQECSSGYYMLEDSWNTDYFYMARLREFSLQQSTPGLIKGIAEIVFDCQPIRWKTTGAQWVEYESIIINTSDILPMPMAIMVGPLNPPYTGDTFSVTVTLTFYSPDNIAASFASNHGKSVITVQYFMSDVSGGGNFIIDALTHDLFCNVGVATGSPLFAKTNIVTQATGSLLPPSQWPEIPPQWGVGISVNSQSMGIEVKTRESIL